MRKISLFALFLPVLLLVACKVSQPGKIESSIMKEVKKTVTIGGKDVKNPVPYSDDAVKEGGGHFQHHCQICHGLDGHATGVPFAAQMSPPVPDLQSKDIQDYSDGQLKWIIENGIAPSGMPSWKGIVDDDEMWKIVHYMRHLPAKGSLGSPAIFKEEEEEHEEMEKGAKPANKSDESTPHHHH